MPQLPDCELRVETDRRNVYYCRHDRVHIRGNLVTPSVCRSCNMHSVACAEPRPLPGDGPSVDAAASKFPPLHRQAWSLTKSLAAFVADGLRTVDSVEYERRLTICDECDQRVGIENRGFKFRVVQAEEVRIRGLGY